MAIPVAVAAVACAILSTGSRPVTASTALYTITDLGSLGGCCAFPLGESSAAAVNNLGEVVGAATSAADPTIDVPVIYQNGAVTALSQQSGYATGINDAGQVTGAIYSADWLTVNAFLYQGGVLTNLGGLPGEANGLSSWAWAINAPGTIVGQSKGRAMIYQDGLMSGVHRRTAYVAYGVNDAGDVVGLLEKMSPLAHAFLYSGNNLIDLGTLDGDPDSVSIAYQINSRKQIVGTSWINGNSLQRAFLYENGVMNDIGSLPGGWAAAVAINNLGHIVGYSGGSAFVYRDGVMIDLNTAFDKDASGIWPRLNNATGINDRGQIVGTAMFDGPAGVRHRAYLLTPIAAVQ